MHLVTTWPQRRLSPMKQQLKRPVQLLASCCRNYNCAPSCHRNGVDFIKRLEVPECLLMSPTTLPPNVPTVGTLSQRPLTLDSFAVAAATDQCAVVMNVRIHRTFTQRSQELSSNVETCLLPSRRNGINYQRRFRQLLRSMYAPQKPFQTLCFLEVLFLGRMTPIWL